MVTISGIDAVERERDARTGGAEYYRRNLAGDDGLPAWRWSRLRGQK